MNLNTQFVFESKLKRNLIIGMGIGALCLMLSAINDDALYTRFWSNYLHNSAYFTGIAMMALFFLSASITAFGGWMTAIKRVFESMSQFLIVGLVLISVVVIGVWGNLHHLYHWNMPGVGEIGHPNYDRIIAGKKGFLNPVFFTIATVGFIGLWYFWAMKTRQVSVQQDEHETASLDYYKKGRKWAATALPLIGFLSPVMLWQLTMSIDSHWYSTMFAWYSSASMFLGMLSLSILIIIYLKSKGQMEYVTREHLHDLGKFLFGVSVFWTYLWYSQFMLIWYANNGEETIYFNERMTNYPVLFWGNLLLNFVTPFFILMRNDTKRKMGTMFFVASIVFFGHWWDFFYMVKPGARISAEHAIHAQHGGHTSATHDAAKHDASAHATPAAHSTESHSAAPAAHDAASHAAAPAAESHPAESHAAVGESHDAGQAKPVAHSAEGHADASHAASPEEGKPVTDGGPVKALTTDSAHSAEAGHEGAESHTATHSEGDHGAAAAHGDDHAAAGHGEGHGAEHSDTKPFMMGFTIPGLEEIGIMIGFLSLFLFFFFRTLERASLVPMRDPYLEESLHHATGVHIPSEGHAH